MPHPLQMLHGNYSRLGKDQARYEGHNIGLKSDRLGFTVTARAAEGQLIFVRGILLFDKIPVLSISRILLQKY